MIREHTKDTHLRARIDDARSLFCGEEKMTAARSSSPRGARSFSPSSSASSSASSFFLTDFSVLDWSFREEEEEEEEE